MKIVIKTKTGGIFGTDRKFPYETIKSDFKLRESLRTVEFINEHNEKITIPFENIDIILETN